MDVTVLGGCTDPSADVLKRLREIGVYLIKFETGNDNLITEGMMRLKLRLTTWDRIRVFNCLILTSSAFRFKFSELNSS